MVILHIRPEVGTVKNDASERDVPLHPHIVRQGFLEYARSKKGEEPLFYSAARTTSPFPQRTVGDDLAQWVRKISVKDPKVAPNHGWRHRLKTVGRDCGMDLVILDAIQGHAPRTEGEKYGKFSPTTMMREIVKIPEYVVEAVESVDRPPRC